MLHSLFLLLVTCTVLNTFAPGMPFSATAHASPVIPPLEDVPARSPRKPDPLLPQAWHLKRIGAFQAWRVTQGNPHVTIAVIDSGVDYNHPDINPNLRRNRADWPPNGIDDDRNGYIDDGIGWDFVRNKNLPWDRTGHGTFVAGVAAGVEGNGVGSAGVCPKCSVLPLRFMNANGTGWDEDGLKAIQYAVRNGAAVINLSFAGEGYDKDYHDALREALARDIVVVAAAGNDGENIDRQSVYPPKFRELPNMIVVAGTDRNDALVRDEKTGAGSNWSKTWVHLAAPGEDILGPWNDGTYEKLDGTSAAAPIVAGAAGLMRSANPKLTAPQIVSILMATAFDVPGLSKKVVSGGVLNVAAAMECSITRNLPCLEHLWQASKN